MKKGKFQKNSESQKKYVKGKKDKYVLLTLLIVSFRIDISYCS